MTRFGFLCVLAIAALSSAGPIFSQEHDDCTYSLLTNGPTWDSDEMRIPDDVLATAWARDGADGGSGRSTGTGFHSGGARVAVAAVSYWFQVTHHPLPSCEAVTFDSQAKLEAEVSTSIEGAHDDY